MIQILWPRSGWHVTPLTSLMEGSQVKKAYQKARLCLHPDKLQQRGATDMQKYVAEKAFTILQVTLSLNHLYKFRKTNMNLDSDDKALQQSR